MPASKTLELKLKTTLDGNEVLPKVQNQLTGTTTKVEKLTSTYVKNGKGVKIWTHAVILANKNLRELTATKRAFQAVALTGDTELLSTKITNNLKKELDEGQRLRAVARQERLAKQKQEYNARDLSAKTFIDKQLEGTRRRIAVQRSIIINGANSVAAVQARLRQTELALEDKLGKDLARVRKNFAKGVSTSRATRDTRLTYERAVLRAQKQSTREITRINQLKQVSVGIDRAIARQRRTQAAQERQRLAFLQRHQDGVRNVIAGHRAWSAQIAQGIGLYRAISFAITGISNAIRAVPKVGIELQTTEAVFEATLGSQAKSAGAFEALKQEAQRTGIAIGVLRETFRNLNASMSLAGENTGTIFKVFTDLNTVSTTLHLSADKTSSVFNAIAQIFNKTKVQSEELVKQLGNLLPGAFASFQRANQHLFKDTKALIDALSQGTVFAHKTVANLTSFLADRFSKGFTVASSGLQANIGRMNTSFTLLGEAIFKVTKGQMTSFVQGLGGVADYLTEAVEGTNVFARALDIVLYLATLKALGGVTKLINVYKLYSVSVAQAAAVTAGMSFTSTIAGAGFAATALAGLKAAFKFLTSPVGIVAGLVTVAFYLKGLYKETTKGSDAIRKMKKEKEDLAKELAQGIPQIEIDIEGSKDVKELTEAIQSSKKELEDLSKLSNTAGFSRSAFKVKQKELLGLIELAESERSKRVKDIREEQTKADEEQATTERRQLATQQESRQDFTIALMKRGNATALSITKNAIARSTLVTKYGHVETLKAEVAQLDKLTLLKTQKIEAELAHNAFLQKLSIKDGGKTQELLQEQRGLELKKTAVFLQAATEKDAIRKDYADKAKAVEEKRLQLVQKNLKKEEAYYKSLLETKSILQNLQLAGTSKLIDIEEKRSLAKVKGDKLADKQARKRIQSIAAIRKAQLRLNNLVTTSQDLEKKYQDAIAGSKEVTVGGMRESVAAKDRYLESQQKVLESILLEGDLLKNKYGVETAGLQEVIDLQRQKVEVTKTKNLFEGAIAGQSIGEKATGAIAGLVQGTGQFANGTEAAKLDYEFRKDHLDSLNLLEADHAQGLADLDAQTDQAKLQRTLAFGQSVLNTATAGAEAQYQVQVALHGRQSKEALKAWKIQQSMRAATIVADTATGAMSAYAAGSKINPVVGAAFAAITVAFGAAQLAQLVGTQPAAHGGLDNVPKEQTYLLDKGERVLSPNQNKDLTKFLREKREGSLRGNGGIMIGNISITLKEDTTKSSKEQSQELMKALYKEMKPLADSRITNAQRQGNTLNPTKITEVY